MAPLTSQKCPANAPIQNVSFCICLHFFSTTYHYITHHQCSKLNISTTSQYFQLASSHSQFTTQFSIQYTHCITFPGPTPTTHTQAHWQLYNSLQSLSAHSSTCSLSSYFCICIIITPLRHLLYVKTIVSDMPCLLLELELSCKV